MSEDTGGTTTTEETNEQQVKEPKEFEAITSQEDFDKAIQARIARERKRYEGYDQYKAAAERLSQLEEAQKSEAQKQAEALQKAEQQLATERSARLRAEVAATKGVPADLLVGGTQEELEASADALIAFKGEPSGPVVPGQGKTPDAPAPENADDWLRGLARQ